MSNSNDEEASMGGKKPIDGRQKKETSRKTQGHFRLKHKQRPGNKKHTNSPTHKVKTYWEIQLETSTENGKSAAFKPELYNNYIFINSGGCTLKFDMDGEPVYKIRTGALNNIRPVIDPDGCVYVINKHELVCIRPSGQIKWSAGTGPVLHAPYIDNDGMIYLATRESRAIALNSDGMISWKKKLNDLESMRPFIDKKGYLHLQKFEGSHIVMNRKRGFFNPSVAKEVEGNSTNPVKAGPNGHMYFSRSDHAGKEYCCMDIDGKIIWRLKLPDDMKSIYAWVIRDDFILVNMRTDSITEHLAEENHLRGIKRKKKSYIMALDDKGQQIFRFPAEGQEKFSRHMAIDDNGTIYLTNKEKPGKLYAISKEGNLLWKRVDETSPISRPQIAPGGMIVTGGKNNSLKAFSAVDGTYLGEKEMKLATGQSYVVTNEGDIIAVDKSGKMSRIRFSPLNASIGSHESHH